MSASCAGGAQGLSKVPKGRSRCVGNPNVQPQSHQSYISNILNHLQCVFLFPPGCTMRLEGSGSLTRDRIQAPSSESMESRPGTARAGPHH